MISTGHSKPRRERNARCGTFELLETRMLLAGLEPGDANEDGYFDEADLVQVMKFGKLNTGEDATWQEGDWNEDDVFSTDDLVLPFSRGLYRQGPYDDEAVAPVNQLRSISDTGPADVAIYYFPENGNVTVVSATKMTALHLVSRSNSLTGHRGSGPANHGKSGIFDVAAPDSQFVMPTNGVYWIEHSDLLPVGWNSQQLIDDLLVDGALLGGGSLGNVRLGAREEFPTDRPDDVWVTEPRVYPTFVDQQDANGLLTYDPQTGDIHIEAIGVQLVAVQLTSPDGLFTGTVGAEQRYVVNNVDTANPHQFVRAAFTGVFTGGSFFLRELPAFTSIYLPGIAQPGLSRQDLVDGIQPTGTIDPNGRLTLALALGPSFPECRAHLDNDVIIGDANFDGRFDSSDLVAVFRAGEYEDDIVGNSTWSEGDWTCNGDFDTGDLVAAFRGGQYELPAAAVVGRNDVVPHAATHLDTLVPKVTDPASDARQEYRIVAAELIDHVPIERRRYQSDMLDALFVDGRLEDFDLAIDELVKDLDSI